MKRPSFILLSLLWLPFGMLLVTIAQGIPLFIEPQAWLGLIFLAPFGLPLALACRALRRGGHVASAWVTFTVLAPATVWVGFDWRIVRALGHRDLRDRFQPSGLGNLRIFPLPG